MPILHCVDEAECAVTPATSPRISTASSSTTTFAPSSQDTQATTGTSAVGSTTPDSGTFFFRL